MTINSSDRSALHEEFGLPGEDIPGSDPNNGEAQSGAAGAGAWVATTGTQQSPAEPAVGDGPPAEDDDAPLGTASPFAFAGADAASWTFVTSEAAGGDAPAPSAGDSAGAPPVTGPAPTPEHNGSAVTSVSVAASGDQRIDGILGGTKWSGSTITYTNPNAAGDYQAGYNSDDDNDGISAQNEGFSQLTAQELLAVHFALNSVTYTQPSGAAGFSVEGFTNLNIDFGTAGSGTGTIRVANSSDPATSYAYFPDNGAYGGDVFIGPSANTPTAGNYSWHTMLHELGHALGLKHGQETGGFGALPANVNSIEYSLMTYDDYIGQPAGSGATYETWGGAQTFMMLDIAALQYMYGADYTINNTSTVYSWNPTSGETYVNGNIAIDPGGNRIFATIWDGGGIDTYDLSNYTTNLDIDLGAGDYSTFSAAQRSNLGGGPNGGFARGNIFNALLYQGNTASLIENANGGTGNDTIDGNQVGNVLNGNNGNDLLYGLEGNDTLNGGVGTDLADGGSGADSIRGGTGNDTLYGDTGNDTLYGEADNDLLYGEGNNDYIDAGTGADTVYVGTGNDTGYGDAGNDYLSGNTGNDFLNGEGDNDTIYGGDDQDTIYGSTGNDRLLGDGGNDSVSGGSGSDTISGGLGNDSLDGGADNDTLDGGDGADTVLGGDGDDVVFWSSVDVDSFDGGAGTDTIRSLADFSAGATFNLATGTYTYNSFSETWANFENYDGVSGTGHEAVIGSTVANNLATGSGNNSLDGANGDDTLSGGAGADTLRGGGDNDSMQGGAGNDVVYFGAGQNTVDGGADTDTILSTSNFVAGATFNLATGAYTYQSYSETWANFENYDGVGGSGREVVIGSAAANNLATGSGNNSLDGANGDDTLSGGAGADTLDGGNQDDSIQGGAGNDVIAFGSGLDTNDGGADSDTILATATFLNGATFDLGAGTYTYFSYTETWANFENYDGSAGIGGEQVIGSAGANLIRTGAGANLLDGSFGEDTLFGGGGADTLRGGFSADSVNGEAGNDLIVVGDGQFIDNVDGGADVDTVDMSAETNVGITVNLGAGTQTGLGGSFSILNVENFIGTQVADVITGDNLGANELDGQGGDDSLSGGDGDDVLIGGDGADTMRGGSGNDTFYVAETTDRVGEASNSGTDLVYAAADFTMTGQHVENLIMLFTQDLTVTANGLDNHLTGNYGSNAMNGMAGTDTILGAEGADTLSGGDGDDAVEGGADNDSLDGGADNDALEGGTGADSMRGGLGNDTYYMDDSGDRVFESANSGTDIVYSSVTFAAPGQHIENVTLTWIDDINATGNALANRLTGNSGANYLYGLGENDLLYGEEGHDTLDGGTGADTLRGGTGDDVYIIDDLGDRAYESQDSGIDTVQTSVNYSLSGQHVENVLLTGTGDISIAGNSLANTLTGNSGANSMSGGAENDHILGEGGADILNGGTGADTLRGGLGDDTFYVDDIGDRVFEAIGAGNDLIYSSVSYNLVGQYIERLTATGSDATTLTGNSQANTLTGNTGANLLIGLGGADEFVFASVLSPGNIDTIQDFSSAQGDKILLDDSIFTGLSAGALAAGAFQQSTVGATQADDRIIYNGTTGQLFYDADGNLGGAAIQFATLSNLASLSASDFLVI